MTASILAGLADASVRISLGAALVGALLLVLRVRASAVRHRAWTAVVCAMLLMPAMQVAIPAIAIPVPAAATALRAADDIEPALTAPATHSGPARLDSDLRAAVTQTGASVAVRVAPLETSQPSRDNYSDFAFFLYAVVAIALLARLFTGWRTARSVAAASGEIFIAGVNGVRESTVVATPMTVGVIAPAILLPPSWRTWPEEKLRAVLAHEQSHVQRRDALVGLLSRVNRSIFWFHPLAWWLDRALASTAEHASDDAAVVTIGERGRYAEILIEMAQAVRRSGGRLSWQGVGIDGSGLLGERIDRILRGERSHDVSFTRKYAVAIGCVAAIVLAAACRPQASVPHPSAALEQRDHLLRIQLQRSPHNQAGDARFNTADAPSIDALETAAQQNPEDLQKLKTLLDAYWVFPDSARTEARRAHILWLIEHHADSTLAGSIEARIYPADLTSSFDPKPLFAGDADGYAQARVAWFAQTSRPGVSAVVLANASYFLEVADKPLAEDLLIRARMLDPSGPWTARLGRFYAVVLAGSDVAFGRNEMRSVTAPAANSAYGSAIRRKLAESNDDVLLTAAGWALLRAPWHQWKMDGPDPRPWAEACFRRALQINPDAVLAHTELLDLSISMARNTQPLWMVPPDSQYAYVSALPEAERFARLPEEANAAIAAMRVGAEWNDPNLHGYVDLAKDRARKYANDILTLAPKYSNHPRYGMAIYAANMTLGSLALADGQKDRALQYLARAADAPRETNSEELTYLSGLAWGWEWRLPRELVQQGEREGVARFLTRMAEVSLADREDLVQAAAALRRGETPPLASY